MAGTFRAVGALQPEPVRPETGDVGYPAHSAFVWRIASGAGGPLFTDLMGNTGLPYLTDLAESCKLRPPQPPRLNRRKGSRVPAKPPETIWPFNPAHSALF